MTDAWTLVANARVEYADMVEAMTPEQVEAPTWCDGWSAHLVTAHLVTFVDLPFPKFMLHVAKEKGDFDAAADNMARKIGERPLTDLVATLRAKAAKKSALPIFPGAMTLVDVIAHTQDVRRPLGLDGAPSAEALRVALDFLTTSKRAAVLLEHKALLDGLRLEASDSDWSHGAGQPVSGTTEALLLGILRRPVFDELTGDGVAVLQQRQDS